MLIAVKTFLHIMIVPPAGPLLLAALGAWLLRAKADAAARRAGWALLIAGLASLWLLSTPIVADALTRLTQHYPALDLSRPVNAQAVVILGGGEARAKAPEYGGEPAAGIELLERLAYGAFVARRTGLPVLVTGHGTEALAMRASLQRNFGVQARWVDLEARDTFENASYSARLLKPQGITRIVLVTTSNHEWRAAHEFEAAGFTVVPGPVDVWSPPAAGLMRCLPNPFALLRSSEAVYEMCGDLVRRVLAATHLRRQSP